MKDSKSMTLLIDTNIIIDILYQRQPFYEDSVKIMRLCENGTATGIISALTCANIMYIMRKELTPEKIEFVLDSLSKLFTIADLTADDLHIAASMRRSDFEDSIQSVCAERVNADYIITRNIKDFSDSSVVPITPKDFVNLL